MTGAGWECVLFAARASNIRYTAPQAAGAPRFSHNKCEHFLLSTVLNFFGRRKRRERAREEPLYFSRLKHLSDDEWRAALSESPEKAARWVEAAAVHGDVDAQLYWAQMLLDGYGTPRDSARAFRWYGVAAESGRADALNMLGRCYERGWGVECDPRKAAEFFRAAAEKSDNWGRFNLACLLIEGSGVGRDLHEAYELLIKAAQEEHAKSFYRIGLFHEHGWARPRDRAEALRWYRRSAEAGDFRGQHQYGLMLLEDGARDEALSWIERCIRQAPIGFCREIAPGLLGHTDERVRAAGAHALAKGNAA